MLEGLVAWVLNNYVGEYFENLNTHQLSIALLQGQVELENVPLKRTALRKFDIPVQVRSGVIGRLTLTIPIHMRSEPWILKMSDVLVLLEPSTSRDDVEFIEQYEQARKQAALDELEQYHKNKLLLAISKAIKPDAAANQNQWWGASLVSAITNNMQVILDNVHVRYEDVFRPTDGHPGQTFNFGIRVESLTMQTTNAFWKPTYMQTTSDSSANTFKRLSIKRISFYWNYAAAATRLDEDASVSRFKKEMSPENAQHNLFVLQPFGMDVRMEKNGSKFPLKRVPLTARFKFDLRPEKIEIDMTRSQLAQIRYLSRKWARFDRQRQHRKWRPRAGVGDDPRAWWQFAGARVRDANRRRLSWKDKTTVLTRVRHLNAYCRAYQLRLEAHVRQTESDQSATTTTRSSNRECIAIMRQIEQSTQFNYEELHCFREMVYRRYIHDLEGGNGNDSDEEELFEVLNAPRNSKAKPTTSNRDDAASADASTSEATRSSKQTPPLPATNGFYAWMSSWFSSVENQEEHLVDEDVNEAFFLDLRPQIEEKNLSPELKAIERRMEEEIMDVLNETWDDSTVLRRDTLLAELVFRLDRIVVRFMDNDDNSVNTAFGTTCNRVLSLDLRTVASRVHLSPREHRTELSLSVEEMNVQRMKILPAAAKLLHSDPSDLNLFTSADDVDDAFDSLLYGVSNLNTQLMLTVGRTKRDEELLRNDHFDSSLHSRRPTTFGGHKSPMLKLFYKRLAPKLDVYHELNIQLSPIFAMYDENALAGLGDFFSAVDGGGTEASVPTDGSDELEDANISAKTNSSSTNSKMFLTLTAPQVDIELRRRSALLGMEPPKDSIEPHPFALAKFTGLRLQMSTLETFICRTKLFFQSASIEDLFERQPKAHWPLIRSAAGQRRDDDVRLRANSCPDMMAIERRSSSALPVTRSSSAIGLHSETLVDGDRNRSDDGPADDCSTDYMGLARDFDSDESTSKVLSVDVVDAQHPQFESLYEQQHLRIFGDFRNALEIGVNRRSWIALLDFFGLMGDSSTDVDPKQSNTVKTPADSYNICCELRADMAKFAMNYPRNGSQLGVCSLDFCLFRLQMDTADFDCPIFMRISSSGLVLSDLTPFYNQLYDHRLILKSSSTTGSAVVGATTELSSNVDRNARDAVFATVERITFGIVMHRQWDTKLTRESDVELSLHVDAHFNASYVHTHRYFFEFLEFWTNFVALQGKVYEFNCRQKSPPLATNDGMEGARCKLSVEFAGGLDLVVPLNQHSEEAIIFATTQFTIVNGFARASDVSVFADKGIYQCGDDDNHDCLLDVMHVLCGNLKIFRGLRIPVPSAKAKSIRKDTWRYASNVRYFFSSEPSVSILSRLIDVKVDVFRNLSVGFSHRVPDLVVLTDLADVELSISALFYRLLRGCLEHNIGETFAAAAGTTPSELLPAPDISSITRPTAAYEIGTAAKYATFCFRLTLTNARMNFLTGVDDRRLGFVQRDDGTGHEPFARMELRSAKLSSDTYVDGQYELYLICHWMELFDARLRDHPTVTSEEDTSYPSNVFTTIITPSTLARTGRDDLMFEAHVLVKPNEAPVIMLVLLNARVFLIFDWLLRANNFILQTTAFVAPREGCAAGKYLYEEPKEGVLVRTICPTVVAAAYYDTNCRRHQPKSYVNSSHSFTLKVTLKEIDLVNVDDIRDANSLLLIALTTGVLTADDTSGILQANFEIQKMSLFLSSLAAGGVEYRDPKIITNDFSATISLSRDVLENLTTALGGTSIGLVDFSIGNNSRSNLSSRSLNSPGGENFGAGSRTTRSQTGANNNGSASNSFSRFAGGTADASSNCSGRRAAIERGFHLIDTLHQHQKIVIELGDRIEAKFTCHDLDVLQTMIGHTAERWATESAAVYEDAVLLAPPQPSVTTGPTTSVTRVCIKCACLNALLMDNMQASIPLFRFVLADMRLEKAIDRVDASMTLSVDYFNEFNFGFEPLVEAWALERLAVQWRDNHLNVDVQPSSATVLNMNLTQAFLQQTKLFAFRQTTHNEAARGGGGGHIPAVLKKSSSESFSYNLTLHIPAGVGLSCVNKHNEELVYLYFRGVKMHLLMQQANYQFLAHVDVVQADNQLLNAERWQFLYCDPQLQTSTAGGDEMPPPQQPQRKEPAADSHYRRTKSELLPTAGTSASMSTAAPVSEKSPALSVEISYTPTAHYDTIELLRVRLCDTSILLDELLLWKLIEMVTDLTESAANASALKRQLQHLSESPKASKKRKKKVDGQPPANDKAANNTVVNPNVAKYFINVLELQVGNVLLSALAVSDSSLPAELRDLKRRFDITLVSFENAVVSITPFRRNRYFCTADHLLRAMSDFYLAELKKQKLSIIVTMDAIGNPMGLASDVKDSFEGLIFDGNVGGFVFGLGYGVTNSISKAASSWAQGVGALTFDEQHEPMRRRMLRGQSQAESPTALSHLYGGVKGLGMGVFGGLTAILKNTYVATQRDGVSGLIRGVTTGALDMVTKPLQGALDLLEGTASAFKEVVGSPSTRRQFADVRLRLPRVCTNLQARLPPYSYELAEAQQMLLRINAYSTSELVFDVVTYYAEVNARGDRIEYRAMVCSKQCYILRQINQEPCTVVQRIAYRYLNKVQPIRLTKSEPRCVVPLEISYINAKSSRGQQFDKLWCLSAEVATRLSRQIMNAKNYYDRQRRKVSAPALETARSRRGPAQSAVQSVEFNNKMKSELPQNAETIGAVPSQFVRSMSLAAPHLTQSASTSALCGGATDYPPLPPPPPTSALVYLKSKRGTNDVERINEDAAGPSFPINYR